MMLLTWLSMWHGAKVGGSGLRLAFVTIVLSLGIAVTVIIALALRGLLQALGLS